MYWGLPWIINLLWESPLAKHEIRFSNRSSHCSCEAYLDVPPNLPNIGGIPPKRSFLMRKMINRWLFWVPHFWTNPFSNWLVTLVRETARVAQFTYHWRLVWNLLELRGIISVLFGSFWRSNSGWFGNPANRSGFGWIWTGQGCLKLLKQKLRLWVVTLNCRIIWTLGGSSASPQASEADAWVAPKRVLPATWLVTNQNILFGYIRTHLS